MTESEVREGYSQLTKLLISKKLSITTMESCTSGQIASLITDTEGASSIFKGAFITYSNEVKVMQGVNPQVINLNSVYSKETAQEMARVCREKYSADFGIGVTGTMGNVDPENPDDSKPGQVYFAISTSRTTQAYQIEIPAQPTRLAYKIAVAEQVLNRLLPIVQIY